MTRNQIDFARVREEHRSHTANEKLSDLMRQETERYNRVTAGLREKELGITQNYNDARVAQARSELAETMRHNRATERLSTLQQERQIDESIRHNQAQERLTSSYNQATASVAAFRAREEAAHNRATEAIQSRSQMENARHNSVMEFYNQRGLDMQQRIAGQRVATDLQIARERNQTSVTSSLIGATGSVISSTIGGSSRLAQTFIRR